MTRRPTQLPGSHHQGGEGPSLYANAVRSDASQEYPFAALVPTQSGDASRRHSMTVQHLLNPSDEEPRLPSQSRSPLSSDSSSERHSPNPYHYSRNPSPGQRSNGRNTSRRVASGRIQRNRRENRRASRQASLLSSASEAGAHETRPAYSPEETHFIW